MSFFEIYGGKLYDLLDVILLYVSSYCRENTYTHTYNRHYIVYG